MIEIGTYVEPPRRRPVLPLVIPWLVILAAMYLIIAKPKFLTPRREAALPAISEMRSPQLLAQARQMIGLRGFMGGGIPEVDVQRLSKTPIDEFRAIIVAGEFQGGTRALRLLDEFEKRHKVVRLREDVDGLRQLYDRGAGTLSAEQKRRLVENHGWFGELALLYKVSDSDARRQAMVSGARNRAFFAMFMGFGVIGAVGLGLVLLIWGIIKRVKGTLPDRFVPPEDDVPFLEAFALYLGGMVLVSIALVYLSPQRGILSSLWLSVLLPAALLYLRARGLAWGEVRRGLGLTTGRGVVREIFAGIIGYLAGLPIMAIGIVLTLILSRLAGGADIAHPLSEEPVDTAAKAVGLFLLASAMAPVVEETMFRGALFGHLSARLGFVAAMLISALIFAAIHPQGWAAIPTLAAIGCVFAMLRQWRGSIIAPMTAHALNNGVAVLVFFLLMT